MGRRIKLVRFHADLLLKMFKRMDGNNCIKCESLPDDAKVVGINATMDFDSGLIVMKIESETFPEIMEGCVYPEMPLKFSIVELSWRSRESLL